MRASLRSPALAWPIALSGTWTLAVLFSISLFSALWPILSSPIAPLADHVNHLARMSVLAHIGDDPELAATYAVKWALIPNLIMDLVVPGLSRLVGVGMAGQLYLASIVVMLVSGPMALYRAQHGHWSPWPLVVTPFVYNGIFLYGLVNYLFGVGVAIWAAAAWIALSGRPLWWRAGFSALVVPVLFVCHLFAVGLYGLMIGAIELARLATDARRPGVRDVAVSALAVVAPFLSVPLAMLASPTIGLAGENVWESVGKFDGVALAFQTYSDIPDLAVVGLVGAAVAALIRRGAIRLHSAGLVFLTLALLVYLAMPRMLFGSWIADQRLPAAVLFLAAGFVRLDPKRLGSAALLVAAVLAAQTIRQADVIWHWSGLDAEMADMRRAMAEIPAGARVLVAHADGNNNLRHDEAAISHAPCVAVLDRRAIVSTLFTVPGKQILDMKPAFRDLVDAVDGDPPTLSQLLASIDGPVPGQRHYWDGWGDRYDFLVVLYTDPDNPANPSPDHLTALGHGARFQLFAIDHDDDDGSDDGLEDGGNDDHETAALAKVMD